MNKTLKQQATEISQKFGISYDDSKHIVKMWKEIGFTVLVLENQLTFALSAALDPYQHIKSIHHVATTKPCPHRKAGCNGRVKK